MQYKSQRTQRLALKQLNCIQQKKNGFLKLTVLWSEIKAQPLYICRLCFWSPLLYPDWSMTTAWFTSFSFRIWIVVWQESDGETVTGVDRGKLWTVRLHHLKEQVWSYVVNTTAYAPISACIVFYYIMLYNILFSHQGLKSIWGSGWRRPFSCIQSSDKNLDLKENTIGVCCLFKKSSQ